MTPTVHDLISAALAGEASEEDNAAVMLVCEEDASVEQALLDEVRVDAALTARASKSTAFAQRMCEQIRRTGTSDVFACVMREEIERQQHSVARSWLWIGVSIAAAVFMILLAFPKTYDLPQGIGREALSQPQIVADTAEPVLYWGDGSRVQLLGPARYQLHGTGKSLFVHEGCLDAEIAPQKGETFQIETPHTTIAVIGTRFSVQVSADTTNVQVEHGTVAVGQQLVQAGYEVEVTTSVNEEILPPRRTIIGWDFRFKKPVSWMYGVYAHAAAVGSGRMQAQAPAREEMGPLRIRSAYIPGRVWKMDTQQIIELRLRCQNPGHLEIYCKNRTSKNAEEKMVVIYRFTISEQECGQWITRRIDTSHYHYCADPELFEYGQDVGVWSVRHANTYPMNLELAEFKIIK